MTLILACAWHELKGEGVGKLASPRGERGTRAKRKDLHMSSKTHITTIAHKTRNEKKSIFNLDFSSLLSFERN